jgi:hypothetical protein
MTLSINDIRLSSIECHYAVCRVFYCYTECHYAQCRYAECYYAECRDALLLLLVSSTGLDKHISLQQNLYITHP